MQEKLEHTSRNDTFTLAIWKTHSNRVVCSVADVRKEMSVLMFITFPDIIPAAVIR